MAAIDASLESAEPSVKKHYVYDLSYDARKKLCSILDMNDDHWKELGGQYLKLSLPELSRIEKAIIRNQSPTNDLLCLMDSQNRTVDSLFKWLYAMKHYQAMDIIKSFVNPKLHCLLVEGAKMDPDITLPRWREKGENADKILVNRYNKENVSNNLVPTNERTKHGSERTTERKLSDESNIEKLDSGIRFIPLEELEDATNGWNRSTILGRGGFGIVFKGYWRQTNVAIKKLEPPKKKEPESKALEVQKNQSLKELKHLNINRHDNILPLYGYSIHDHKYVLVYQYMPNGSLDDRLHRTNAKYLPWSVKYNIAKGTARGLQFLHGLETPLVHGDIKSANILLDSYFNPKIGDFGLAREGPTNSLTHVRISKVYGTRPYLPHEFIQGKKLSGKVDVYSFGVVLFEIATGKKPFDDTRSEKFLRDYVYNYDETLIADLMDPRGLYENHMYLNLYEHFIKLGKACVDITAKNRPDMIEVFKILDEYDVPLSAPSQKWSLFPPSCPIMPPTSVSPVGSHDPRRSPSPTKQPSRNSPQNLQHTGSPSPNVGFNLPASNQPQKNLTPHLQVVTEVSSCDKAPKTENILIQPEGNQKLHPVPNIKLIITSSDKLRGRTSNDQIISGISSLVSTSESEPSTHYTNTSNGDETLDMRSEDKKGNKESIVSSNLIPAITLLQDSSTESNKSSQE